jgi:hypothetical protein
MEEPSLPVPRCILLLRDENAKDSALMVWHAIWHSLPDGANEVSVSDEQLLAHANQTVPETVSLRTIEYGLTVLMNEKVIECEGAGDDQVIKIVRSLDGA